jgi:hypothetical protein
MQKPKPSCYVCPSAIGNVPTQYARHNQTGVSRTITDHYCMFPWVETHRNSPDASGCVCYRSINAKLGASILRRATRRAPDVEDRRKTMSGPTFTSKENVHARLSDSAQLLIMFNPKDRIRPAILIFLLSLSFQFAR